jgi:hypothetical protein
LDEGDVLGMAVPLDTPNSDTPKKPFNFNDLALIFSETHFVVMSALFSILTGFILRVGLSCCPSFNLVCLAAHRNDWGSPRS